LASNSVYSIVSDSRGFLWFATAEGLSRFDGSGFWNQTVSTGLPHSTIQQVLIGQHGNYWLATPAGLVRFRPDFPRSSAERMMVIKPGSKPGASSISVLFEGRDGILWCGTDAGLYAIGDTASPAPQLAEVQIGLPGVAWGDTEVTALTEDAQGGLWIGTTNGVLYRRLPDHTVERYPALEQTSHRGITTLRADRRGRIWVGTADNLYRSISAPHPGANGFERLSGQNRLPQGHVFDIFESRDGDVWVGIYRCLAQFPADGAPVRVWTKENGLPGRGIGALGQDQDGNMWLGTGDLGAFKLVAGGTLTYSIDDGIGADGVISIAETLKGELYTGGRKESEGFRVALLGANGFQAVAPRLPRSVTYLGWRPAQVLLQDHTGEWWLASSQGLCRYPRLDSPLQLANAEPKSVYTTLDGLPGNVIVRLYEDRRGNIWIGSETNKLGYWSGSEQKFVGIPIDGGGVPGFAAAFAEDTSGNMWIGDEDGQLWRVREGRASLIPGPARKAGIQALFLDRTGRLWAATNGQGVLRFDEPAALVPRFRQFGFEDGLSSLKVLSLVDDAAGFMYLGSGSGVDRLDSDQTHIRHYTSADGIAPGQVISAYRDRTGTIWFGTNHGLTRLVSRNDRTGKPPPVWITGLSIAGRPATVSEAGESSIRSVEVQPGQEQIQFDFVGLSYAPGDVLRYQYRLGGENWSNATDSRSVHYGVIAPGTYRFEVHALNSNGEVSLPATVDFRVVPALSKRLWFQAILLAMAITGALWLYRVRRARSLEVARVRMRIATDLHDDIGSSLSQIAILSDVAQQRAKGGSSGEPIERIGMLARELLDSIGDIVWAIQPQKDYLSDLRQRMRRFAGDVLSARNVEMHW
jgi:ligand-binding sensor domain-containing protein